jgi:alpha-aminoadipate/glutamate carrier protein LysW
MPTCPECEAMVDMDEDEVEEGEVVSCPECGVELEVISTNPLELNLLDEEEEEDEDLESDDDVGYEEDEDEDEDEEEYEDEEE